jgi:hypothetical protein
MKTRSQRDPQQTAQYICGIPCECGRRYIVETSRLLAVRLHEHRHNLQQGLLGKRKFGESSSKVVLDSVLVILGRSLVPCAPESGSQLT